MQRSDVLRFKVPKGIGHEHMGERFGVIVQANEWAVDDALESVLGLS